MEKAIEFTYIHGSVFREHSVEVLEKLQKLSLHLNTQISTLKIKRRGVLNHEQHQ